MDWQAKWIWAKSHLETPNFYMYARKEIELASASSAKVFVTCSTEYKLYANGRYVGRGPNPCHPKFQYYEEYDFGRFLRTGKNVIAALCYNYGVGTHCRPEAPGAFLLQLEVANGENGPVVIGTDDTWKVKPADDWDFNSPQMFWTVGFQEIYDSRKKPVGWNVVGYDDAAWEQPQIVGEVGTQPWTNLVPRQIPPLRECELLPEHVLKCGSVERIADPDLDIATRMHQEKKIAGDGVVKYPNAVLNTSGETAIVSPGQDTFIVLDFGKEVVGFPILKIKDGGCGILDIGYSEALDENGDVFPDRQKILQADRFISHGGRQEWQTFGRRAFRYMQLTFRDLQAPVEIEAVVINRVGYPVEQVSTFECSDPLLNSIWKTGLDTLTVCMQDAYEDCPLREHGQYPGDARVQALMNYYCFFDSALAAKALRQFVQSQREDGLFNALWPSSTNHILPDYNLVWIMMLHDHYLYVGDRVLVAALYSNMRRFLEGWVRTQESENGLLTWEPDAAGQTHEWWLFIDHAFVDKHGEVAAYNAFYYQALRDAAKLASAFGNIDDAIMWHDRAESVLRAFNERFWNEEQGVYVDCNVNGKLSETVSVQTNTLAVLFGLANSERSARVRENIISHASITQRWDAVPIQSAGPYFDFYVLQAMAKLGMDNEALALVRLVWGEMLRRGAKTWWESLAAWWGEDALCPDSLCHAWSGAPTYFLPAEVLGVKPSMPESNVVIIQPRPGDLEWAKGHVVTHGGCVDVEWHSEPECFSIDIDAPEGFIVALPVGRFDNPKIDEIDLSPETPERRARASYGWGTTIWRDGDEHDPYLDWLKSQDEKPPRSYQAKTRCSVESSYVWVRESAFTHVRYEVSESGS